MIQSLGLAGELVTPQEATAVYQREYRELSAQVVFFSATNYLSPSNPRPPTSRNFTRITSPPIVCLIACKSATWNSTCRIISPHRNKNYPRRIFKSRLTPFM
ncbi:MAG: hypothetical protein WDM76_19540 [Limisphaerales bacterium]